MFVSKIYMHCILGKKNIAEVDFSKVDIMQYIDKCVYGDKGTRVIRRKKSNA